MENPQPLKKRKSFRRWIKKVTTPKVAPLLPKGVDSKQQGVFGVPLVVSISYARGTIGYQDADQVNHQRAAAIPLVVSKCGSYLKRNGLETEGIFRLSGSTKRVNTLQQIFDSPQDSYGLHHTWKNYNVHDAGSILRRYFLRLPDPVIPVAFYQRFRDVMNDSMYENTNQRIDAFQTLICQLPTAHQHLLFYVLDMLRYFATNASITRMDAANIAAVFSPGLLSHPQHNSPVQYMISQRVIEFLIEYQNLFTMDLLVETEAKPVEPDEALVSPNIHHRRSITNEKSSSSSSSIIPAVPAIPSHWASSSAVVPTQQSLSVSPTQSPIPNHQEHGLFLNRNPVPTSSSSTTTTTHDQKNDDTIDITDEVAHEDDIPTPRPGSPIDFSLISLEKHQTPNNAVFYWKTRLLRPIVYFWKDTLNLFLFIWYTQLLIITSIIVYEIYMLYSSLAIIEPCLFFGSFFSFGYLLIYGVDFSTMEHNNYNNMISDKDNGNNNIHDDDLTHDDEPIEKYHIDGADDDDDNDTVDDDDFDKCSLDESHGDGLSLFDDVSMIDESVSEEALMRDKEIMANWQHLMTRSWRAAPDESDNIERQYEPYPALGNDGQGSQLHVAADDGASMLSIASRFNEDDDDDMDDDDDDDDDLLSTTEEDLQELWSRYEQFKQDEELAEKLQQEEQARGLQMKQDGDGKNPFLQNYGQR